MPNNTPDTDDVGVLSARVDERAWVENQVLAHTLAEARKRLALAEQNGSPESRIKKLTRDVSRAGEAIYLSNKGLARRVAGTYARRSRDPEDLYQIADEALWKAITRWEPTSSPLASWAYRYIEKACRAHVARHEHGLSSWAWQHRPAVLAAARELEAANQNVDPHRVAQMAEVTLELATLLLDRHYNGSDRSLDMVVGDGGTTLADIVDQEEPELVPANTNEEAYLEMLEKITEHLDIVDLCVWIRTKGVDFGDVWPTESLEQICGVSAETIRRAARRADAHIAAASAEAGITELVPA